MKIFAYIFGTMIIVGLLIWGLTYISKPKNIASYSVNDPNSPKIEVAQTKFDFGKISVNDIANHEFTMKNTGKTPLNITNIITSCHCTSAILKIPGKADSPEFGMVKNDSWQGAILPGDTGTLVVTYKPSVMPVKGMISRVITLTSNDPNQDQIQFEITADVE
jgi:hypothetical protein